MTLYESLPATGAGVDSVDVAALPRDFLWGTATSAYQIEGGGAAGGRGAAPRGTVTPVPGARGRAGTRGRA
ncbi:family 1 glycosylhydrolase, partial [Streptomyces erythrochromogenes]|uniref:family 1 glycosylhydrolase n=1 Tax=Streptomyces erythrochromogenes TaxID=285574 RepID=UPI0036BDF95A